MDWLPKAIPLCFLQLVVYKTRELQRKGRTFLSHSTLSLPSLIAVYLPYSQPSNVDGCFTYTGVHHLVTNHKQSTLLDKMVKTSIDLVDDVDMCVSSTLPLLGRDMQLKHDP